MDAGTLPPPDAWRLRPPLDRGVEVIGLSPCTRDVRAVTGLLNVRCLLFSAVECPYTRAIEDIRVPTRRCAIESTPDHRTEEWDTKLCCTFAAGADDSRQQGRRPVRPN